LEITVNSGVRPDEPLSPKERILQLTAYPPSAYRNIDLNRLTLFTIQLLDSTNVPATLEHISVANFRLFPVRFAMVGFKEYPDVSRVNRALLQLRPKYRNWATGNATAGWALTPAGVIEAKRVAGRLASVGAETDDDEPNLEPEDAGIAKRTVDAGEDIARIRRSSLFSKYQQGWTGAGTLEVFDVLEAYSHTPPETLRRKLGRLRATAVQVGDHEMDDFLKELGDRYTNLFQRR
jgi:hypothetical protein